MLLHYSDGVTFLMRYTPALLLVYDCLLGMSFEELQIALCDRII